MLRLRPWERLVAVLMAVTLPLASASPALAQEEAARGDRILQGKILDDEGQAIEGAIVKVRNLDTGQEIDGAPTGSSGSYKITELPPGRYEVAVETERGIYLGNRTVDLVNKTSQTYSFSLRNVPPEQALEEARRAREAAGEEEDEDETPPAPPPTGRPETGAGAGAPKVSYWSNPWTATLTGLAIVVAAAVTIDEINDDDDDDDGSPSSP